MSTKATDRRAKIEAAAPKGRGGANKIVVATVVAVLAIAAIVTGVIVADQGKKADLAAGGSSLPKNASAMGAGLVVNPTAPSNVPTLDLWVDFQCPACASFEGAFGDQMAEMAEANEAKLVVHVLSFLDKNLGNDSSNRAANAAFCAADQDRFLEYHQTTFAEQPEQEGTGYTDAQLEAVRADRRHHRSPDSTRGRSATTPASTTSTSSRCRPSRPRTASTAPRRSSWTARPCSCRA